MNFEINFLEFLLSVLTNGLTSGWHAYVDFSSLDRSVASNCHLSGVKLEMMMDFKSVILKHL